MTIRRGAPWGVRGPCPGDLAWWPHDAAAARAARGGAAHLAIRRSGVGASVGVSGAVAAPEMLATPWDLLRLVLHDGTQVREVAVLGRAWVVPRALRGDAWILGVTSPVGDLDLHPRAHPNDGLLDVLAVDAAMPVRDRIRALGRARRGDHLPHPALRATRGPRWSSPDGRWLVWADGRWAGRATRVDATLQQDATTLHW